MVLGPGTIACAAMMGVSASLCVKRRGIGDDLGDGSLKVSMRDDDVRRNASRRGRSKADSSAVTGKVMASSDHQIPRSAEFEAKAENQTDEKIESEKSIQNQETKEAQASEEVSDPSCAQAVKDTFQSQAHVPQTEKKSSTEEDEASVGSKKKKKKNKQSAEAQESEKATGLPCTQPEKDTSQSQAQVPQPEKKSSTKED